MMTLKVPGVDKPLSVEAILWIEGNGNYAWLHFSNQEKQLVAQTLKWFEDRLPSFFRVHKSSLINWTHLVVFERRTIRQARVVLSNGIALLVSRRRVQPIADRINENKAVEAHLALLTT